MRENLDKTNQQKELKISSMDKREFTYKIKQLFHSMPTSEDVRFQLVPIGVKNTARLSKKFKKDEIFKFEFKLKDGYLVELWFHSHDPDVNIEGSNAKICPVMRCIITDSKGQSYDLLKKGNNVNWLESNKLKHKPKDDEEKKEIEKKKNASHLPLIKLNTKM